MAVELPITLSPALPRPRRRVGEIRMRTTPFSVARAVLILGDVPGEQEVERLQETAVKPSLR